MEDGGGVDEEGVVSPHGAVGASVVEPRSVRKEPGHYAALDRLRVT